MAQRRFNLPITRYESAHRVGLVASGTEIGAQKFLDQRCKKTKSRLALAFRVQSVLETTQVMRLGWGT